MLQSDSYFGAKPCASERRLNYNASLLLPATGWHISSRNQHKVGTWRKNTVSANKTISSIGPCLLLSVKLNKS